jgi:hypothetical protein
VARGVRTREKRMSKKRIARIAERLLTELELNSLEVVLVPDRRADSYGNDFRRLRAVQTQNAEWYQRFCARHLSNRRGVERWAETKTKIKRQHTRRALNELMTGRCESPYARILREFIEYEYSEH